MFMVGVDTYGFDRHVERTIEMLGEGIEAAVRNAAQEGAREAITRSRFKNRTGQLRANIVAEFLRSNGRSAQWEILSRMPYSKFVEEGTRPHEIRPKAARALRWVSNGQVFFARVVHHPGSVAYPFMGLAYLKAETVLYRDIYVGIDRVARTWVA